MTKLTHSDRSWPLTIISLILAGIVVAGIVAAWRHLQHDLFLVTAVIIPAGIMALFLLAAAVNGHKSVVKGIYGDLLELLFFWQM